MARWHSTEVSLYECSSLAIISSAIAIPSAQSLDQKSREFIIYESSLSDIIGVIVFNFVALNAIIDGEQYLIFHFS